jgi:hypothetical protein
MMTEVDQDFEARLTRVLTVGAEHLPVGRVVPVFDAARPAGRRLRRGHRRMSRKVAMLAATATLAVTGTAAAVTIAHLTSAPVTETDVARCYSTDSLAGGDNFAGLSTAAAGPIGSSAQVTSALAACTTSWADGFLTLGSTQVGGTRQPPGILSTNHPVPSLVVCVLPGGIAGVFPGDKTTCQTLGLPAAEGH